MTLDLSAFKPVDNTVTDAAAITAAFTAIEVAVNGGSSTQLGYTEFSSIVTTTQTVVASATTIVSTTAVLDGATSAVVQVFIPWAFNVTTNDAVFFSLWDGSTNLGNIAAINQPSSGYESPIAVQVRLETPSAATHTYTLKFYVDGGTGKAHADIGGAGVAMPGYIRVVRA